MKSDTYFILLVLFVAGFLRLGDSPYSHLVTWILLAALVGFTLWIDGKDV